MFRVIYYPKGRDSPEIEDFNNHKDALQFIESLRVRLVPFETASVAPYSVHRWDL